MTYESTKKKFSIPDYVARVNALVKAAKSGETSRVANPGLFAIDIAGAKKRKAEAMS